MKWYSWISFALLFLLLFVGMNKIMRSPISSAKYKKAEVNEKLDPLLKEQKERIAAHMIFYTKTNELLTENLQAIEKLSPGKDIKNLKKVTFKLLKNYKELIDFAAEALKDNEITITKEILGEATRTLTQLAQTEALILQIRSKLEKQKNSIPVIYLNHGNVF